MGGEIIFEVENIQREKGYLYYVSFKTGHMQVGKAKMQRGKIKKQDNIIQ